MQSTGQTSTQVASLTPIQGSVITKGITHPSREIDGTDRSAPSSHRENALSNSFLNERNILSSDNV